MPRTPLPIGTWGEISIRTLKPTKNHKPVKHLAHARFRDHDGRTLGYGAYLDLTGVSEAVIGEDPGTRAVWNHVLSRRPPSPGEWVKVWRFLVEQDADARFARLLIAVAFERQVHAG